MAKRCAECSGVNGVHISECIEFGFPTKDHTADRRLVDSGTNKNAPEVRHFEDDAMTAVAHGIDTDDEHLLLPFCRDT